MISVKSRQVDSSASQSLKSAGFDSKVADLFSARGVKSLKEAKLFLKDLLPVSSLTNATEMADVLANAIMKKEKLLVIADYDADGATSCTICVRALKAFGANVEYLIPNRLDHGYGLTPDIVEVAKDKFNPDYIITVDNGIASHAGVAKANELGIKVLVTDHHLPAETHPDALLIVNPNQHGCSFESKSMAGCGVAFYVMWALEIELTNRKIEFKDPTFGIMQLLPFVAVGTVADLVSLDLNNRILVKNGLNIIRKEFTFPGIEQLCLIANKNPRQITTSDIGFQIGPRINAAGRLESMDLGVECLITESVSRAKAIAKMLNDINKERKEIEKEIVENAVDKIIAIAPNPALYSDMSVVLHNPEWHEGVIGIAASRIKDKLNRPTIILTTNKLGQIKGSCRSIPGFHLRDALVIVDHTNPGLLIKYGGHAMAAGLTIRGDGLEQFKAAFEKVCQDLISRDMLELRIETDGSSEDIFGDIDIAKQLKMEVWGQGFPEPSFFDEFVVLKAAMRAGNALGLELKLGEKSIEAIQYKFEGDPPKAGDSLKAVYTLDATKYNEKDNLKLIIAHVL